MNKDNFARVGVLIAIVIAIVVPFYVFHTKAPVAPTAGGVTNYDEVDATAIKVGGANGSRIDFLAVGTCSLVSSNYTVNATSSAIMDCSIPGLVASDTVYMWFSTSTIATTLPGWAIYGAVASTTANGFAEVRVVNWTGASSVIPANIASSTNYEAHSTRSTVPGL